MPSALASSEFVWHDDGDVVIVCEGTGFCVHVEVLASQSAVFRDMANIPQPPEELAERHKGYPMVRLQDSAEDMRYFLEAIYDLHSVFPPSYAKLDFTIASALLRLGTKYDASSVRRQAIDVFASVYPCTSDAWSRRDSLRLFPPFAGELGATLALAIQNDVQSLLPSIFYTASKLPPPDVLSEFFALELHPAVIKDLCARFVTGREALRQAELKLLLRFFSPSFTRPRCSNLNSDTVRLQLNAAQVLFKTADDDPYQSWCAANPFKVGKSLGLCKCCCELIENSIRAAVEEIWRRVPGLFGFADWERLRDDDDMTAP